MTALARATDPVTSHQAAARVNVPLLELVVLDALTECGDNGATLDELVARLGMDKVTISPRLRPLTRRGLAVASTLRRPGASGRGQTVWMAA